VHEILPKKIATSLSLIGERIGLMMGKNVEGLLPLQGPLELSTAKGRP